MAVVLITPLLAVMEVLVVVVAVGGIALVLAMGIHHQLLPLKVTMVVKLMIVLVVVEEVLEQ
jgi:hypothetical protein